MTLDYVVTSLAALVAIVLILRVCTLVERIKGVSVDQVEAAKPGRPVTRLRGGGPTSDGMSQP